MISILLSNLRGYGLISRTPCNFIGSIISAAASHINAAATAAWQSHENALNRKWQSAENEKQRDFQRQMTEDYETLQAQREQADKAGLNANVIFGQGSTAGVASAPSSSGAPNASTEPAFASALNQGAAALASLDVNNATSRKANAEADLIKGTTPSAIKKSEADGTISEAYAKLADDNANLDLQLKNSELLFKGAQTAAQNATANKFDWEAKLLKYDLEEIQPIEKEKLQLSISEDLARIGLLLSQKKLTDAQAKLAIAETYKAYSDAMSNRIAANAQALGAQASMLNAQTNQAVGESQIRVNDATAENLAVNSVKTRKEAVGLEIDNDTKFRSQKYVLKSFETQCEILGKQNAWFNANQVGTLIKDVGVGFGSLMTGSTSVLKGLGSGLD